MVLGAIARGFGRAGTKLLKPGVVKGVKGVGGRVFTKAGTGIGRRIVKGSSKWYAKNMTRLVKQTGLSESTILAIAQKGGGAMFTAATAGAGIGATVDHVTKEDLADEMAKIKEELRAGKD